MKCITYMDGVVKRVSNERAFEAVSKGVASFVPKSEWKKIRDHAESTEVVVDEQPKKKKKK